MRSDRGITMEREGTMTNVQRRMPGAAVTAIAVLSPSLVLAQSGLSGLGEAMPTLNSGDTAWMMVARPWS